MEISLSQLEDDLDRERSVGFALEEEIRELGNLEATLSSAEASARASALGLQTLVAQAERAEAELARTASRHSEALSRLEKAREEAYAIRVKKEESEAKLRDAVKGATYLSTETYALLGQSSSEPLSEDNVVTSLRQCVRKQEEEIAKRTKNLEAEEHLVQGMSEHLSEIKTTLASLEKEVEDESTQELLPGMTLYHTIDEVSTREVEVESIRQSLAERKANWLTEEANARANVEEQLEKSLSLQAVLSERSTRLKKANEDLQALHGFPQPFSPSPSSSASQSEMTEVENGHVNDLLHFSSYSLAIAEAEGRLQTARIASSDLRAQLTLLERQRADREKSIKTNVEFAKTLAGKQTEHEAKLQKEKDSEHELRERLLQLKDRALAALESISAQEHADTERATKEAEAEAVAAVLRKAAAEKAANDAANEAAEQAAETRRVTKQLQIAQDAKEAREAEEARVAKVAEEIERRRAETESLFREQQSRLEKQAELIRSKEQEFQEKIERLDREQAEKETQRLQQRAQDDERRQKETAEAEKLERAIAQRAEEARKAREELEAATIAAKEAASKREKDRENDKKEREKIEMKKTEQRATAVAKSARKPASRKKTGAEIVTEPSVSGNLSSRQPKTNPQAHPPTSSQFPPPSQSFATDGQRNLRLRQHQDTRRRSSSSVFFQDEDDNENDDENDDEYDDEYDEIGGNDRSSNNKQKKKLSNSMEDLPYNMNTNEEYGNASHRRPRSNTHRVTAKEGHKDQPTSSTSSNANTSRLRPAPQQPTHRMGVSLLQHPNVQKPDFAAAAFSHLNPEIRSSRSRVSVARPVGHFPRSSSVASSAATTIPIAQRAPQMWGDNSSDSDDMISYRGQNRGGAKANPKVEAVSLNPPVPLYSLDMHHSPQYLPRSYQRTTVHSTMVPSSGFSVPLESSFVKPRNPREHHSGGVSSSNSTVNTRPNPGRGQGRDRDPSMEEDVFDFFTS